MIALEQQLVWHEHQVDRHKTTHKLLRQLVGNKETGEAAEATGQEKDNEETEEKGERGTAEARKGENGRGRKRMERKIGRTNAHELTQQNRRNYKMLWMRQTKRSQNYKKKTQSCGKTSENLKNN